MEIEGETIMKTDIIIVGAGVAGSALAYTLAKDGRRVHVIERDLSEPNRLSGELLQPGGYLKLMELGLQDCVNGIDAQKFYGFVFFKDGKEVKLTCPLENLHPEVAGRSFHNGRFVQKMREKAASLTNVRLEQGSVTMLIQENGSVKGVHYKTNKGQLQQAYAPLTIVCDGIFSNLRRTLCNSKVEIPSYFVGMVLDKFEFPYPNYGNFVLAQPSSILVYPLSSTEIRCTIDVPSHKLPSISNGELSRYLKTVVAPQIPPKLYDAFVLGVNKGSFDTMASKNMAQSPRLTPGALILGDAFNMRHPITGGGMTVALSDVIVLRDLLRKLGDLNDAKSVSISLQSFYTLRKPMAFMINTMATMVHKVFSEQANEPLRKEIPILCFDYMRLQGNGPNGLISFTSGLNPRPIRLFFHFFAIAVYGIGRLLLPFPSPIRVARFIQEALSIIFPILKAEGVVHMLFPITMPTIFRVTIQRIIDFPKKKKISSLNRGKGHEQVY